MQIDVEEESEDESRQRRPFSSPSARPKASKNSGGRCNTSLCSAIR